MIKKIFVSSLLSFIFLSTLFPESEDEFQTENETKNVGLREIAISVGDVFLVNMFFNSTARILLKEEYSETNIDTMKENLKSKWIWDEDGYFMNQFGHPYQGALYFTSGRSNGLSFAQSFFLTAGSSFFWEEFGETTTPSINDIITTPICGTLLGEVLHRLFLDTNDACPALAWLFSPIDALNLLVKGTKGNVYGHIEQFDLFFHGNFEYSHTNFAENFESENTKKPAGGGQIQIQYGDPEAHDTKEPFDLFKSNK